MTLKEKILFHEVHPAKLATGVAAGLLLVGVAWTYGLLPFRRGD
jgi:hypothetical protein